VLCAVVMLAALAIFGFAPTSATELPGHGIEAVVTMGSDLVSVNDTRHSDEDCGHDHKSAECPPCPSCSGAVPSTADEDSHVVAIVQAPLIQSLYHGVVPSGVRRPPKLS